MAEGESLRSICRDPGMPSEATVRGWSLRDHDGFDARYRQRACCSWTRGRTKSWTSPMTQIEIRATAMFALIRGNGLMSKIAPKRYGDRLLLAGDAASPLQVMHQQVSL